MFSPGDPDATILRHLGTLLSPNPPCVFASLEHSPAEVDEVTRMVVHSILARILGNPAPLTNPKTLHEAWFTQMRLLGEILSCESKIRYLRTESGDEPLIEALRARRRILKLLGSSLAWQLLNMDRPYIRAMTLGADPGFLAGKAGTLGEFYSAIKYHEPQKMKTELLHGITGCLLYGDASRIEGANHAPGEVKLRSRKHRIYPRERRQMRWGRHLVDYLTKNYSEKIIPVPLVRYKIPREDNYNWSSLNKVAQSALEDGVGMEYPEAGICYFAGTELTDKQMTDWVLDIKKKWNRPRVLVGDLIRAETHIDLRPYILYLQSQRAIERLIFRELTIYTVLDIRQLVRSFKMAGLKSWLRNGGIRVQATNEAPKTSIGPGLTDRVLYEGLSISTLVNYMREAPWGEVTAKFRKAPRGGGQLQDSAS